MLAKVHIVLNDHVIEIKDAHESLGMGGPFMGTLSIDNSFFFKDVLVDFVYSESEGKLFFAKMFTAKKMFVDSYYFNILIFDLDKHTTHYIGDKYKYIYLNSYDGLLNVNLAFHSAGTAIKLDVIELMQPYHV